MKRYNEIVLKASPDIEFILEEKNGKLIVQAVNKSADKTSNEERFFSKITSKEREEVSEWVKGQEFKTNSEKDFEKLLKEALNEVKYDYCISNIEPSVDKTEKLIFAENMPVAFGYSYNQFKEMSEAYNLKRGSRIATLYELFIWYAYRIAKGYWTLDFVAIDSSSGGNYWNAPDATQHLEKTGAKICGGFKDGQGNTYKLVTHKNGIAIVGGNFADNGNCYPVSDVNYSDNLNDAPRTSSWVVVLTK